MIGGLRYMKTDNEKVDIYEGKITIEERLMLLLTGIFCFPVGFALYFYFEGQKDKKYHVHFARIGAWSGFIIVIFIFISVLMFTLANYLQF